MIDEKKREQQKEQKAKTRKRIQIKIDPENYEYTPAKKQTDYYDNDVPQMLNTLGEFAGR